MTLGAKGSPGSSLSAEVAGSNANVLRRPSQVRVVVRPRTGPQSTYRAGIDARFKYLHRDGPVLIAGEADGIGNSDTEFTTAPIPVRLRAVADPIGAIDGVPKCLAYVAGQDYVQT